ncbi:ATP-binding cassette domain-containing protein [Bacillus lacus]|uniref:ATP-binding cassette domain-containing protein n=1 Tax=Metabacillus lacus TaxID=1983721 RepID=A0A7X2IZ15_9BACI|nr:ABC transporter ATP-binding protein [Metabacillus lacus]MRX72405.1 ATP-binding cassette domain-containing protein [Metabacillus lacus]
MNILEIENLTITHAETKIVQSLSLSVSKGEWLALAGESGSGKSVTAAAIGGLLPNELNISGGSIVFDGNNMTRLTEKKLRAFRGKGISYVFQDYQGAFTPFLKVGRQIDEMLKVHTSLSKPQRKQNIVNMLERSGLPGERVYGSYPSQLSGGQLQRAAICAAMILKPKLLIADEPTTALDSITAASILRLIADLKSETHCAVLFITHDLRHVKKYADSLAVMLNGELAESGETKAIFENPCHPYTQKLFSSIPSLRKPPKRLMTIQR